ncbi:MAG TPA: DUF4034 domain-containing protein [Candidatus Acidoferrales bacterium]|nr:DUF4034 domain-containing protein [Candidatus Acidoferrales bacterium]
MRALLFNAQYDQLDKMAETARSQKLRFPGGEWQLRYFYTAIDAPVGADRGSEDHLRRIEAWAQSRPNSVTARVALAKSYVRYAWEARGNGMADTVTPLGWRLFAERLHEAHEILDAAEAMSPPCPEVYSTMQAVALGENLNADGMRQLFERAIQIEPEYFYLYDAYANYLLPKWDGRPGDSAAFARESADRVSGSAGDILYFEIATVLIKMGNGNFEPTELDWQRIQRGHAALEAAYGGARRERNQFAFMAVRFKDAQVARQEFSIIGDDWGQAVWRTRQQFDRARDWALAHGGTAGS